MYITYFTLNIAPRLSYISLETPPRFVVFPFVTNTDHGDHYKVEIRYENAFEVKYIHIEMNKEIGGFMQNSLKDFAPLP